MTKTIALREVQDRPARCRSCNAPIRWAVTAAGRSIALEEGSATTRNGDEIRVATDRVHFANCPNADQHRRQGAEKHAETAARALAPKIAQLELDLGRAATKLEQATNRAADATAALARVLELAKTAARPVLVDEIEAEIARLEGPPSDSVYPPSSTNRPRYAGD